MTGLVVSWAALGRWEEEGWKKKEAGAGEWACEGRREASAWAWEEGEKKRKIKKKKRKERKKKKKRKRERKDWLGRWFSAQPGF